MPTTGEPANHVDGFTLAARPELVPSWALVWFAVSSVLVLWDASYVLLQPVSFYPEGRFGACRSLHALSRLLRQRSADRCRSACAKLHRGRAVRASRADARVPCRRDTVQR